MVERQLGGYVIAPLNIGARVAMRPESAALAAGLPRTSVDVQLSAVSLALCEQQVRARKGSPTNPGRARCPLTCPVFEPSCAWTAS